MCLQYTDPIDWKYWTIHEQDKIQNLLVYSSALNRYARARCRIFIRIIIFTTIKSIAVANLEWKTLKKRFIARSDLKGEKLYIWERFNWLALKREFFVSHFLLHLSRFVKARNYGSSSITIKMWSINSLYEIPYLWFWNTLMVKALKRTWPADCFVDWNDRLKASSYQWFMKCSFSCGTVIGHPYNLRIQTIHLSWEDI